MSDLQLQVIKEHFGSVNSYKNRRSFVHMHDPIILEFIKKMISSKTIVLEVGGGSGYMLDLINRECSINGLINCEIIPFFYKNQVNENIVLVGGDALHLPFKSNVFDFAIIKNVFHHLVGRTRRESMDNVINSIKELKRVVKRDGYIIVLEIYNEHRLFADCVFYFTLFCAQLGITIKRLDVNQSVIVSFLTPNEIKSFFSSNGLKVIMSNIIPIEPSMIYKFTLLMKNTGYMLLVSRIVEE